MPRLPRVHDYPYHMVHPPRQDVGGLLRHGEGGDRMSKPRKNSRKLANMDELMYLVWKSDEHGAAAAVQKAIDMGFDLRKFYGGEYP